jgi:hypothetical protein
MHFRHLAYVIMTVVSLIVIFVSCQPSSDEEMDLSHAKATVEWRRHERILEESLKGPSDPDELLKSVIFFQRLTGLSVRGDTTTFGLSPNQYTATDLEALRRWYAANEYNLYWDEEEKSVKLRGDSRRTTGQEG